MGKEGEGEGKRGKRKRLAGVVQEGAVRIHLVQNEQGATERVAL